MEPDAGPDRREAAFPISSDQSSEDPFDTDFMGQMGRQFLVKSLFHPFLPPITEHTHQNSPHVRQAALKVSV